jgi:hypothetical protein
VRIGQVDHARRRILRQARSFACLLILEQSNNDILIAIIDLSWIAGILSSQCLLQIEHFLRKRQFRNISEIPLLVLDFEVGCRRTFVSGLGNASFAQHTAGHEAGMNMPMQKIMEEMMPKNGDAASTKEFKEIHIMMMKVTPTQFSATQMPTSSVT